MESLSAAQLKQYQEDGYLIVENFLTEEECEKLRTRCRVLVDENDFSNHPAVSSRRPDAEACSQQDEFEYFRKSGDKIRFFFEEGAIGDDGVIKVPNHQALNKVAHGLHALDPEFKKITLGKKVEGIARSLQMVHPAVAQSMYIFKQPRFGGVFQPHQDSTYLFTSPMTLVGLWIALEDADIENSCLWFVPKSHKNGLGVKMTFTTGEDGEVKKQTIGSLPVHNPEDFVACPAKKGSLVLIDGLVLHRSGENTSNRSRHVYTFHIYDAGKSEWSKDNWLQPTDSLPFPMLY